MKRIGLMMRPLSLLTTIPVSLVAVLGVWVSPASAQQSGKKAAPAAARPAAPRAEQVPEPAPAVVAPPAPTPAAPAPGQARPQSSDDSLESLPPAPPLGILDEGRLFSAEQLTSLAAGIGDFQKKTGIRFWAVTRTYIFGESAKAYSARLIAEWAGGKPAIMVLYDRSTNNVDYTAAEGTAPDSTLTALFQQAADAQSELTAESPASERLTKSLETLLTKTAEWKANGVAAPAKPVPAAPAVPAEVASAAPPTPAAPPGFSKRELPSRPAGVILDEADVLSPEQEAALQKECDALFQATGSRVYVVSHSWLEEGDAAAFASRLATNWLGDEPGAVIVFDRSSAGNRADDALGIGVVSHPERWIPPIAMQRNVERARAQFAGKQADGPDAGLQAAARSLMADFREAGAPLKDGDDLSPHKGKTISAIMAALALGSLLLYLFQRMQEKMERKAHQQFFFPDIDVSHRFGARYGGGTVAEVSWAQGTEDAPPPGA